MYEQMKNDFLMQLTNHSDLANDSIQQVLSCLDLAVYNYDISQKNTELISYNFELPSVVKTFIVCKSVEGYSKGTLYNYKIILSRFFTTIKKTPEQITTNDIRVYLYTYQQERHVSNRSLDKVRSAIAAFYNWLMLEGYVDKNPTATLSPIKYEKKPKAYCTQMDLEYLRRSCKTLKQKAILEFLYSTGCRVGELVVLKKSDIDWENKTVHLFGKGQKHRTSFLNAKAEVALKDYLLERNDNNEWLFVSDRKPYNQMHVSGVQKIIREIAKRANNNVAKKVTCHTLRHTCATTLANNDANLISIQKILGHSNIGVTMNYIHMSNDTVYADHLKAII